MNRTSTEEALNKAYRLAYFLHQDKSVATRIIAAATQKLNVAMAVQSKRLYYVPVGRFSRGDSRRTDGIRNKTLFSDLHLLQRLVYVESEPYERQKERAAQVTPPGVHAVGDPANEEDLLVYFIKHLVRITTKRNAFYVTLGVSRLLHSYSTLETMEIYNAVIGEPERVKDDYYYRSRKAVLMQELTQRFGQLVRACRRQRGEERFETQPGSSEQRSLVRECLRVFTPWDTQCPVPPDFNPFKSVIASLTSTSSADENRIEISRIHAVLHPHCFERLVAAFGYCPPEKRMELPRFFLDHDEDDEAPPRQRSAPADLSAEELAEINHALAEQSRRRRRSSSTAVMRIMVDGIERARLNPAEQSSISFSAGEDAELIEVRTTDAGGDLLLGTHLLTSFATDAPEETTVYSIRLEGGQDLSLSITRSSEANGGNDLLVKFDYRETDPRRAARLWWQRLNLRGAQKAPDAGSLWGGRISPRHIFALSVLMAISLASFFAYVSLKSQQTSGPATASSVQPTAVTKDYPVPATPGSEPIQNANRAVANATATPQKTRRSRAVKAPRTRRGSPTTDVPTRATDEEDVGDITRSTGVVANLTLKDVKKIYIELRGDAAPNELRTDFLESLNSSGVVAATTNPDEADASLKIVVSQTEDSRGAPQFEVSARLVNARGTVLWPNSARNARRYSGDKATIVSDIIRDLVSGIRLARAGQ